VKRRKLLVVFAVLILLASMVLKPRQLGDDPAANAFKAKNAVKSSELPSATSSIPAQREPYSVPPINDPSLASFVNRKSPRVRVPPDIVARFPSISDPIDQEAVAKVLLDVFDDDSIRNEAAELLARSNYPRLVERLEEVLHNPQESERFRGWAVQHVGTNARSAQGQDLAIATMILRGCLNDAAIPVRREALLALVRIDDQIGRQSAIELVRSDDPAAINTQDIALRCLGMMNERKYLLEVRRLAKASNANVKIAAINLLADWRDVDSKPLIENCLLAKEFILRVVAQRALERIEQPETAQPAKRSDVRQF